MRAPRLVRAAVVALAALSGAAFAALPIGGCQGGGELLLCGEIPPNGCPLGRGGSCDDVLCAGLYDCVGGQWTLALDCKRDGGPSSSDAGPDAACMPATISHEGEFTGCTPDLQNPDCPVAAAESVCRESVCLTSCTDFFLCTKDGWSLAAYCEEEGELVIAP